MDHTGCRLCLGSSLEDPPYTIEDSPFKEQLVKVFTFSIERNEGLPHAVCLKCFHTVSEFYQFSETVRQVQEQLLSHLSDEKKIIKIEPTEFVETKFGGVQETSDFDPENELKEENTDGDFSDGSDMSYEPANAESGGHSSDEDEQADKCDDTETIEPRETRQGTKQGSNAGSKSSKKKKLEKDGAERCKPKRKNPTKREQIAEQYKLVYGFYKMACDLCTIVTEDFPSLKTHFQEVHQQAAYISCCKRKLGTLVSLVEHMNSHINPNAYKCEICNKTYSGKHSLDQHRLQAHASPENRPFKCDICAKSFPVNYMLRQHMKSHEKAQCMECGKVLSTKGALRAHQIKMHSDIDRRMYCDTCGRGFMDKFCFQRHVQEHKGVEVLKRLQCHLCNAWLLGERVLEKHLQHVHYERDQTHICNICGKRSANSRALVNHKKKVHVEEKYECEFCGAKFKQAVNLKEHRTIHTGEVLYSCPHCGIPKNSRSNLYVHIKNIHPVEWAAKKRREEDAKIPKS